jgi:hypothetical protein
VLKSAVSLPLRILAAVLTSGTLATASAQSAPPAPAPPADPRAASPLPATPDPNADFLAKASQLYYSSAKAGLRGFDCQIHPDWRTTILSEHTDQTAVATSPEVQLLKSVTITLHGRLSGGSTVDWNPPPSATPLNPQSEDLLDHMHQGVERSLTGFMQFWAPFVDGSVIPATSQGIEITHSETVHTIHADQEGVSLTEILGKDLVIQQFNVVTGDAKINFSPRYKSTAQGLLASGFNANMQGPSEAAGQAQHMQVEVEYQTVSGFPIPARIVMEVAGGEKFDFALEECVANPPAS